MAQLFKHLPLAEVMISWFWDGALRVRLPARWGACFSLSLCSLALALSLSQSLSQINKIFLKPDNTFFSQKKKKKEVSSVFIFHQFPPANEPRWRAYLDIEIKPEHSHLCIGVCGLSFRISQMIGNCNLASCLTFNSYH